MLFQGNFTRKEETAAVEMFKGENRKDGGWRDSSTEEQRQPWIRGLRESQSSGLRVSGVPPPALGFLAFTLLVAQFPVSKIVAVSFMHLARTAAGSGSTSGRGQSDPNICRSRDPGQARSCPCPGCLTDWGGHRLPSGTKLSQTWPCSLLAVWPWTS